MSELLIHRKKKQKTPKRRRLINTEDQTRKKVRFNISSTIYEDQSAI